MVKKFSDIFIKGKGVPTPNTPLYTACVSVLLYKAFFDCGLIWGQIANTASYNNNCPRFRYKVPNNYTPPNGTKHCLRRIYKCYNYSFNNRSLRDKWINEMCRLAKTNQLISPEKVEIELRCQVYKCIEEIKKSSSPPPPNSTRA